MRVCPARPPSTLPPSGLAARPRPPACLPLGSLFPMRSDILLCYFLLPHSTPPLFSHENYGKLISAILYHFDE